jgi:hypothetical protein
LSKLTALSRHEFLVRERRLLRDIGRRPPLPPKPVAVAKAAKIKAGPAAAASGKPAPHPPAA